MASGRLALPFRARFLCMSAEKLTSAKQSKFRPWRFEQYEQREH
jgi:hypothetical protein